MGMRVLDFTEGGEEPVQGFEQKRHDFTYAVETIRVVMAEIGKQVIKLRHGSGSDRAGSSRGVKSTLESGHRLKVE